MKNTSVTVTGGSGFIGEYLVNEISKNNTVSVVDKKDKPSYFSDDVRYYKYDLSTNKDIKAFKNCDVVIHLAGFTDVQESISSTRRSYEDNLMSTITVLENMKKNNVDDIIFTSTSAIYGDKSNFPIEEDEKPQPKSDYGSSKLAAENLIKTRSNIDDLNYYVFRLANIVGKGGHGVIQDFVDKLHKRPSKLKILGNGLQEKSYLHVQNCVNGILSGYEETNGGTFNVSTDDTISVNDIADIVSDSMGLDPKYTYTGGSKGWVGDVPKYKLSIDRIRSEANWSPDVDSYESVRRTVESIIPN
jgi:UDP-glucose 4-epimerase